MTYKMQESTNGLVSGSVLSVLFWPVPTRRSGGVVVVSSPVSDNNVCNSVGCAHHAVEDAIGEPQALTVDVDETAMHGTAVEADTDAGTVCHAMCDDGTMVVGHSHLDAVLAVTITVTNLVVTSHSVAGHEHRHHGDCCE